MNTENIFKRKSKEKKKIFKENQEENGIDQYNVRPVVKQ